MNNDYSHIVVYHGSTSLIETIDVSKGKPYKDFGRGFYVTQDYTHAKNLAARNKRLELERYGFLHKFSSGFNVKRGLKAFLQYSETP
jgi:hypothetical protein